MWRRIQTFLLSADRVKGLAHAREYYRIASGTKPVILKVDVTSDDQEGELLVLVVASRDIEPVGELLRPYTPPRVDALDLLFVPDGWVVQGDSERGPLAEYRGSAPLHGEYIPVFHAGIRAYPT
jgi:hypothetical protein